jgi:hypothetical protein
VSVDWVTVAVGVLFMLNAWWVSHKVRDLRDRVAQRGGDVERFERFRQGKLMRAAPRCAWSLASSWLSVPVQGVLCFTAAADLPVLGKLTIRGHLLLYRKALSKRLNAEGPL